MLNSLLIRARERRREVALYRALGMTPRQLVHLLTAEGAALGLTGAAFALILGAPSSHLGFVALREVSGLDLVYHYPVGWALICGALCVLTGTLSSLYPARVLAREEVAEGLKYC
jgi:putative ABC transport system permease protein